MFEIRIINQNRFPHDRNQQNRNHQNRNQQNRNQQNRNQQNRNGLIYTRREMIQIYINDMNHRHGG